MIKLALGALAFLAVPAIAILTAVAVGGTTAACIDTSTGGPLAADAPIPAAARTWVAQTKATCPDLPEPWIAAVMAHESDFRPDAHADDANGGTWGLLQLNATTWQGTYGHPWDADLDGNGIPDIDDPLTHARVAGTYLCNRLHGVQQIRATHPDWASSAIPVLDALVIAHNAGETRLRTYPNIPTITARFLTDVDQHTAAWTADNTSGTTPENPSPAPPTAVLPVDEPGTLGCVPALGGGQVVVPAGTPVDIATAVRNALAYVGVRSGWSQLCDRLACRAYGYLGSGFASAKAHWTQMLATGHAHPGDTCPPLGAITFWNTGRPYGHASLVVQADPGVRPDQDPAHRQRSLRLRHRQPRRRLPDQLRPPVRHVPARTRVPRLVRPHLPRRSPAARNPPPRTRRTLTMTDRGALSKEDRLAALHEQLITAVADLVNSDRWRHMLTVAARFPTYSPSNVLLIATQRPDATRVAGIRTWNSLNRRVIKGEHGIAILAPCTYRTDAQPDTPASTSPPSVGLEHGEPVNVRELRGFRVVHVFDVSQTDGEPLPGVEPALLTGDAPGQLWDHLSALVAADSYTLERLPCPPGVNGYTSYTSRTVRVRDDVDPAQATKTLAHELGHIRADHEHRFPDYATSTQCRGQAEIEAESIAYLVAASAGLDTTAYSLPYLADWSDGHPERLRESATQVLTAARSIGMATLKGGGPHASRALPMAATHPTITCGVQRFGERF